MIKYLSAQAVFNKVAKHLLTQKHPAMDDSGDCVYLADDGKRCAIGCLIPKRLYNKNIEFCSVEMARPEDLLYGILKKSKVNIKKDNELLIELQNAHDNYTGGGWAKPLKKVAAKFNLKYMGKKV